MTRVSYICMGCGTSRSAPNLPCKCKPAAVSDDDFPLTANPNAFTAASESETEARAAFIMRSTKHLTENVEHTRLMIGYGWVCEKHPKVPFETEHLGDDGKDCGGAGMPCKCNGGEVPTYYGEKDLPEEIH